jgi:hypothetical protein
MLKHYIMFFDPGAYVTENTAQEVKDRDPNKVNVPDSCYAFQFFDRNEIVDGDEVLKGEPKNYSGHYYFGKILTLAELKRKFPEERTWISNMECNHWDYVVHTRCGNFRTFSGLDEIVNEEIKPKKESDKK